MRKLFSAIVVPHDEQRYETVGDWQLDDANCINVTVSRMQPNYEILVGVHELIEAILCRARGINDDAITAFDKGYEDAREDARSPHAPCGCIIQHWSEPGDDKHAPYHIEHGLATSVERMLCAQLGENWNEYSQTVLEVCDEQTK